MKPQDEIERLHKEVALRQKVIEAQRQRIHSLENSERVKDAQISGLLIDRRYPNLGAG